MPEGNSDSLDVRCAPYSRHIGLSTTHHGEVEAQSWDSSVLMEKRSPSHSRLTDWLDSPGLARTRWTHERALTCGYGHWRTGWTGSTDLRIRRLGVRVPPSAPMFPQVTALAPRRPNLRPRHLASFWPYQPRRPHRRDGRRSGPYRPGRGGRTGRGSCGAEAFAEPGGGDGPPGHAAGEQPWAGGRGSDPGVGAAGSGQLGEYAAEAGRNGDLVLAEPDVNAVVSGDDLLGGHGGCP